jgi:plasmid stabilization system protein ParE
MKIEWLVPAIHDLRQLRDFILPNNPEAAQRAVKVIKATVALLNKNPRIGKPAENLPDYHDIVIPFGSSGYLLRYRIQGEYILIVAIKHGKEAGFTGQE